MANVDKKVADGFGDEWTRFDQRELDDKVRADLFDSYFHIFPWSSLPERPTGADFGCGSGRWAVEVAHRVGKLYCVDASAEALAVATKALGTYTNCEFINASINDVTIPDGALDFGYSLGVLHHVPDTRSGLAACVAKLKSGAPFLLYLYYRFDNRPWWFRTLWRLSELGRHCVSRLPMTLRYWASQVLAVLVYWPLARLAALVEKVGLGGEQWPLAYYRRRPFYVMRTDALDRFGTRLERRFTRTEMEAMMVSVGLERIHFSDSAPYWCAVGFKK